jgi:hypothetical protein
MIEFLIYPTVHYRFTWLFWINQKFKKCYFSENGWVIIRIYRQFRSGVKNGVSDTNLPNAHPHFKVYIKIYKLWSINNFSD